MINIDIKEQNIMQLARKCRFQSIAFAYFNADIAALIGARRTILDV